MENNKDKDWKDSKETKKALKVSDCELMHLRTSGKVKSKKVGRKFFYKIND